MLSEKRDYELLNQLMNLTSFVQIQKPKFFSDGLLRFMAAMILKCHTPIDIKSEK